MLIFILLLLLLGGYIVERWYTICCLPFSGGVICYVSGMQVARGISYASQGSQPT